MAHLIDPKQIVQAKSLNVRDLLSLQHTIPPYQREYVWTEKVVEQLWDDLFDHYRRSNKAEKLSSPEGYFMGALVVIDNEDSPYEVVDGQQRLTTLSTVFSVLYAEFGDSGYPENKPYNMSCEACLCIASGGILRPRIEFYDDKLSEFFVNSCVSNRSMKEKRIFWCLPASTIKLKNKRGAYARIRNALECGHRKLSLFLDEAGGSRYERLTSFFDMVAECVILLRIISGSYASAYTIFDSINNRGIRLSQADLIKNELLKLAPTSSSSDIVDDWNAARLASETGGFISLPDLIHFSYLSRYSRVKASKIYETVRTLVTNPCTPQQYVQELREDAEAIEALTEKFPQEWNGEIADMLNDHRNVLGVKLCYPFLLTAYRLYRQDLHKFERCIRLSMNFCFRFMKVLDGTVEGIGSVMSDASRLLREGQSIEYIETLFRKHAPDEEFKKEFKEYSVGNAKLGYFVCYWIEKHRLKGSGTLPVPHGKDQNLEHIMPKSPLKTEWAVISGLKDSDPDGFREYLWRVGNLIPLPSTPNKSIQNRGFSHKFESAYSDLSLAGLKSVKETAKFLDSGDWTYKSIEDRQAALAEHFAVAAWPI